MIGPRSALFTPFPNLGMIIIDEEHEGIPTAARQHRVTMQERRRESGRSLKGLSWYSAVRRRRWKRITAQKTDGTICLSFPAGPQAERFRQVTTVDLRQELKEGNRSILSRALYGKMRQRLEGKTADPAFFGTGEGILVLCRAGHAAMY